MPDAPHGGRHVPSAPHGGDALSRRLARGSIVAFAIHVCGAGLTYCSQLLIARAIGADGFGIYAYVFASMTMLAYLAVLGFDVSLLRFIPDYQAHGDWPLLRGVIRYAERWAAVAGLAVAVAGVAVVEVWGQARPPALTNTFLAGFALVPILALLWVRGAVVRAFGGVATALAPDRIVRDGLLLGMVGLAAFGLGWRIDAPAAMLGTLLSALVGLGLVSLARRRRMPHAAAEAPPATAGRIWAATALPLVVIGVAGVAVNRTGVMLLGWAGQTTDAGVYAMAFNVAFLVVLPRTAVNALFAPAIAGLFAQRDMAGFQALATKTSVWTLLGAACLALPLALLADPLMRWFGRGFSAGVPALRLLLLGQVIAAGAGSQLFLLTMTGHERSAAVLMLANAVVNAAVCAVLIYYFGLTGAAVGATSSIVLWSAAMALLIKRLLRVTAGALPAFRRPIAGRAQGVGVRPV
jgi:O-antigen/teichoic acid export membrane protein